MSLGSIACGDPGTALLVELRTDFVPVREFAEIRTDVSQNGVVVDEITRLVRDSDVGHEGIRVAEFDDLTPGSYEIRVRLLDSLGAGIADSSETREVQDQTGVTITITRGDNACGAAPDCERLSECTRTECVDGRCFVIAEDSFCARGEFCDTDRGCLAETTDGGVPDAGTPNCDASSPCDDEISCTEDRCVDGFCQFSANDARCLLGAGGMCNPASGCQYDECTEITCVPENGCQTATCDGNTCILSTSCGDDQACCAGSCVAPRCDDGNLCTDDRCGSAGCENTSNTAVCDDGLFCNGEDACSDGACAPGTGEICSEPAICNEETRGCVGCLESSHCPPTSVSWDPCLGPEGTPCAETGTQQGVETSYACTSGACIASTRTASRSCALETDGDMCGDTIVGTPQCTYPLGDTCAETGTERTTTTTYSCMDGACLGSNSTSTGSCSRVTDGMDCRNLTTCQHGSCNTTGTCMYTSAACRRFEECCLGGPGGLYCAMGGTCLEP